MGQYKWNGYKITSQIYAYFQTSVKKKDVKGVVFQEPWYIQPFICRFLAVYGKVPWNDEVPNYFENLFYAELFLGMKADDTGLPSEFYSTRRGQTYEHKGALRNIELPHPLPPLVPQIPCMVTLQLEMDIIS